MYKCNCCGAEFTEPYAHHPCLTRRISPEYGDAALLCCPECGEESWEEEDNA